MQRFTPRWGTVLREEARALLPPLLIVPVVCLATGAPAGFTALFTLVGVLTPVLLGFAPGFSYGVLHGLDTVETDRYEVRIYDRGGMRRMDWFDTAEVERTRHGGFRLRAVRSGVPFRFSTRGLSADERDGLEAAVAAAMAAPRIPPAARPAESA
jgi:hypothetical protein